MNAELQSMSAGELRLKVMCLEDEVVRLRGEQASRSKPAFAAALIGRIDVALKDFTSGRASMHVPPIDTDVDMVLAECRNFISATPQPAPDVAALVEALDEIKDLILKAQGQIHRIIRRGGDNITLSAIWSACEYLDAAIAKFKRGA